MKYLKPIISAIVLLTLIYFLSVPIKTSSSTLPPLAFFFNPFTGFWQNGEKMHSSDETINIKELLEEVIVKYDDRHVPHIYANNLHDMLFVQGYIEAKERLWQMDITTRAVEGRTSEVIGAASLERDKKARALGMGRSARLAADTWASYTPGMEKLNAYCDGINYYINSLTPEEYPLEFKLLDYKPELWSPYRTALFIKAMSSTLNSGHSDVGATNALHILGPEKFDELYPDYNKKQQPIIQEKHWEEKLFNPEEQILRTIDYLIMTNERSQKEVFVGSNNFAVDSKKSKNGYPILANDPHLGLTLPAIWIEIHLVSDNFNAYGVSLPGLPGIMLGFNEHIAWGQTNSGLDVLDLYKINWVDASKNEYYLDGKKEATEVVIEEYNVKGGEKVYDTIRYTYFGPVRKDNDGTENLAQKWISHLPPYPEEPEIYLRINQSKDYEDFKEAISFFYAPMQNFIFGSTDGDIAMNVTGLHPVKRNGQGRFILDGGNKQFDWETFIPRGEMPHEFNPQRGFVSSANQHSTDRSYPFYYNGGFEDYRGRYIFDKLSTMEDVTKEDMMNLQLDAHSLMVEEAIPKLITAISDRILTTKEKEAITSLNSWNFEFTADTKDGTLADLWWNQFYRMTFDEILANRDTIDFLYPENFRLIEMVEENPNHELFDIKTTDSIENFEDIAYLSFKAIGIDSIELKTWSEERNSVIPHISRIEAFRYDDLTTGGHSGTPNALSKSFGPSWRMVVELSKPIKAYGIYPGGISGNPGSPYYDNFIEDWAAGKYYELNYTSDPEKVNAESIITFKSREK